MSTRGGRNFKQTAKTRWPWLFVAQLPKGGARVVSRRKRGNHTFQPTVARAGSAMRRGLTVARGCQGISLTWCSRRLRSKISTMEAFCTVPPVQTWQLQVIKPLQFKHMAPSREQMGCRLFIGQTALVMFNKSIRQLQRVIHFFHQIYTL